MPRWLVLFGLVALLVTGCDRLGWSSSNVQRSVSDPVLRLVVQDADGEIETADGKIPRGLKEALNAGGTGQPVELPAPPQSTLRGSVRMARSDGRLTFFVLYEVKGAEAPTAEAVGVVVNETPWQVVAGQSGEDFSSFSFQSTRSGNVSGTVVVQPLPPSESVEIVVARDGKEVKTNQPRLAFIPVLGAQIENRDGAAVIGRVVPGASTSDLREGDRIVRVAGTEVKDAASAQAALRGAGGSGRTLTSVMYIVHIVPETPVTTVFTLPAPRSMPKDFPAPGLIANGLTPVAVQWSTGSAGGTYSVVMLTKQSPPDAVNAYRPVLQRENLPITSDTAQGFGTQLEFAKADGTLSGSITIDQFESDDSYTVVSLQLRSTRGAPGSPVAPRPSATPAASATPAGSPAR